MKSRTALISMRLRSRHAASLLERSSRSWTGSATVLSRNCSSGWWTPKRSTRMNSRDLRRRLPTRRKDGNDARALARVGCPQPCSGYCRLSRPYGFSRKSCPDAACRLDCGSDCRTFNAFADAMEHGHAARACCDTGMDDHGADGCSTRPATCTAKHSAVRSEELECDLFSSILAGVRCSVIKVIRRLGFDFSDGLAGEAYKSLRRSRCLREPVPDSAVYVLFEDYAPGRVVQLGFNDAVRRSVA